MRLDFQTAHEAQEFLSVLGADQNFRRLVKLWLGPCLEFRVRQHLGVDQAEHFVVEMGSAIYLVADAISFSYKLFCVEK